MEIQTLNVNELDIFIIDSSVTENLQMEIDKYDLTDNYQAVLSIVRESLTPEEKLRLIQTLMPRSTALTESGQLRLIEAGLPGSAEGSVKLNG